MTDLDKAIEARMNAKFLPKAEVRHQYYDCVTFALCVYKELGVLPQDAAFPAYSVFTKGDTMLKLIYEWVESSKAFEECSQIVPGALVVISRGNRGHHVGVATGSDRVAHCSKFSNVTIEDVSSGRSWGSITKIYKPHGL